MAQPTNTFDSYDAGNTNAEDVQNVIYMVSPEKTPALSAGRRFKAQQKAHEWTRDSLAAPSATNAVIEGDDRTGTAIAAPGRVGNYTQLMDKVAVVARTQQASKQIGRTNEMRYQVAKQMTELKRDVEARLVSILPAVAGDSSTARRSAGLGALIYTNTLHNGSGATASHATGFPTTANTAGTARTFTEALVKTAMQNVYVASGEMPTFALMSPSHKTIFSGFSGIATNRYNIKGKEQATIIGGADVYVSDFGNLTIVPNYIMVGATDVYLLSGDNYGVAYLDSFQSKPLADTGHSMKELCWVECTNVVTAEAALGRIANLTA